MCIRLDVECARTLSGDYDQLVVHVRTLAKLTSPVLCHDLTTYARLDARTTLLRCSLGRQI
jgi:hypothetical protein